MNSSHKREEPLRGEISVDFTLEEIAENVKKRLNEIKHGVELPGFRKGKVPESLIEKKYGTAVRYELAEQKALEEVRKQLDEAKFDFIAGPVRHDLSLGEGGLYSYRFVFALAPNMFVEIDENIKMPYYEVEPSKKDIDEEDNQYRYSTYKIEEFEEYEDKDRLVGRLVELSEEGTPMEKGIDVSEAMLMPSYFRDEDEKSKFEASKVGREVRFNPYKAFAATGAVLADLFQIEKEEVENHQGDFLYTIEKIKRHVPSELGEEFYQQIFGEETGIKDEKAYRKELSERIRQRFDEEAKNLFRSQLMELLLEKAGEPELDKETIVSAFRAQRDENLKVPSSEEELEREYGMFSRYTYYDQLLSQELVNIGEAITREQIEQAIRERIIQDMLRYGYNPEGMAGLLDQLVNSRMEDRQQVHEVESILRENAIAEYALKMVTLEREKLSLEDFRAKLEGYYKQKQAKLSEEHPSEEE